MAKNPRKTSAPHSGSKAPATASPEPGRTARQEDDLIRAPRGRSKAQVVFLVALLAFLLVIFIIPGSIQGACSGRGEFPMKMAWDHPERGRVELDRAEFLTVKQEMARMRQSSRISDREVATQIVMEEVALAQGVRVPEQDLAERIREIARGAGDAATYKAALQNFPGGLPAFEREVRESMRMDRYGRLLRHFGSLPTPKQVEKAWHQQHEEVSFEYVSAAAADFEEKARGGVPEDQELEAWFQELVTDEPYEKIAFQDPDRYAAEVVWFPLEKLGAEEPAQEDETSGDENAEEPAPAEVVIPTALAQDASALLEAYPAAEDYDAESAAQQYYQMSQRNSRFRRPEPLAAEDAPDPMAQMYFPLDEVRDLATLEADVHRAMTAFLEDVRAREEAGEEVDLQAEAERLGLRYLASDEPWTRDQWRENEAFNGLYLSGRLVGGEENKVMPALVLEEDAVVVGRVTRKIAAALPEFSKIRDKVADKWVERRSRELAEEALQDMRVALGGKDPDAPEEPEEENAEETDEAEEADEEQEEALVVDADAFRAAAETAGLTVETRDWFDKGAPAVAPTEGEEAPAARFLRTRARQLGLYELEEGEVAPVAVETAGDRAYLFRLAGTREMGLDAMKPADFDTLRRMALFTSLQEFATGTFSWEYLRDRYNIDLRDDDALREEEGVGEELP